MFFEFYQIFFLSIYRLFWLNTVTFCDTCSSYKTLRLHSNHKTRLYFVNLRISDKTDTIMSLDIASFKVIKIHQDQVKTLFKVDLCLINYEDSVPIRQKS